MTNDLDHRYAGRRRDIHGDISERIRRSSSADTGLAAMFPSARILGRLSLAGLVLGGGVAAAPTFAGAENVGHSNDDDNVVVTGDDDDEVEIDGDGDNTVDTGSGDDDIDIEGDGDNTVSAGPGDDLVVIDLDFNGDTAGSDGANTIDGGDGDDFIAVLGAGTNTIDGGAGSDYIESGNGADVIDGGDDNDWVEGDTPWLAFGSEKTELGDDIISGGSGNDVLFGDGDSSLVVCLFNAQLEQGVVDCGDDTILGGAGNDWIEGNLGSDSVDGGDGNDIVVGDDLVLYLDEHLSFDDSYERLFDLLRGDIDDLTAQENAELMEILTAGGFLGAGDDDTVIGGAGADILSGMNGNDIVCGDTEDLAVLGGGGTDVPCAVFEETLDASSGMTAGDLSVDMRDLDDEDLEVDEDGAHNPYEFVIDATLLSSDGEFDTYKTAKGTVVINRNTGAFTYTADPGATGTEDITYTLRRRVVACADYSDTAVADIEEQYDSEAHQPDCESEIRPQMIVDVDGVDHLYSLWRMFSIFLGEASVTPTPDPIVPIVTPVVVPVQASTAVQLPKTGNNPEDLALAGMALLALGGLATAESRRRIRSSAL